MRKFLVAVCFLSATVSTQAINMRSILTVLALSTHQEFVRTSLSPEARLQHTYYSVQGDPRAQQYNFLFSCPGHMEHGRTDSCFCFGKTEFDGWNSYNCMCTVDQNSHVQCRWGERSATAKQFHNQSIIQISSRSVSS